MNIKAWVKPGDDIRFNDPFKDNDNVRVVAIMSSRGLVHHEQI
jgi:hypothetical protein